MFLLLRAAPGSSNSAADMAYTHAAPHLPPNSSCCAYTAGLHPRLEVSAKIGSNGGSCCGGAEEVACPATGPGSYGTVLSVTTSSNSGTALHQDMADTATLPAAT